MIFVVYLYQRGGQYDYWNASFIISYSLIQLVEYYIWRNKETKNDTSRESNIVKNIPLILYSQAIVQSVGGLYYKPGDILLKFIVLFFIVKIIDYLTNNFTKDTTYKAKVGPHGHLIWEGKIFNNLVSTLYLIGLSYGLFAVGGNQMNQLLFGFITYWILFSKYYATREFSSMWCFVSVGYSLLAI